MQRYKDYKSEFVEWQRLNSFVGFLKILCCCSFDRNDCISLMLHNLRFWILFLKKHLQSLWLAIVIFVLSSFWYNYLMFYIFVHIRLSLIYKIFKTFRGHLRQLVWPRWGWKYPWGQGKQGSRPVSEDLPGGHASKHRV